MSHPLPQALHSPQALRSYSLETDPSPPHLAIASRRFETRLDIQKDGHDQVNRSRYLHDHFTLNYEDHQFAFIEGVWDIEDAVRFLFFRFRC